jgi:methylated-DNA-[protein]-cysteine S-methyltransferase
MKFSILPSDLGAIVLSARNGRLSGIDVFAGGPAEARAWAGAALPGAEEDPAHFEQVARLLNSYFDGAHVDLAVPVDLSGLKTFTRRVLEETMKIPYGRVATYRSIALRLGMPAAARAVGQALKRNPIPLVIPCHRVIKSDGSLGGFAMGLDIKTRLLSIEGIEAHELRKSTAFS